MTTVSGIHLLLTYKCTAQCAHCFLSCSPQRDEVMSASRAGRLATSARKMGVDHAFIEGGEPFLFPGLLRDAIAGFSKNGIWVGALSNGFFGSTEERAMGSLRPMVRSGLDSLDLSYDSYHAPFVSADRIDNVVAAADELGLRSSVNSCDSRGVICRGRAATVLADSPKTPWQKLTECRESLASPRRVHVGPSGEVHLCQGLLLGGVETQSSPIEEVLEYSASLGHPIVDRLTDRGPAGLAEYAAQRGFSPDRTYVDGCQLCFEARRHLSREMPEYLGPAYLYAA